MEKIQNLELEDLLYLGGLNGYTLKIFDRNGKISTEQSLETYDSLLLIRSGTKAQEELKRVY